MSPKTFVLVGRSGGGKGTQARLLTDYIQRNDTESLPFLYVETGQHFRDFISKDGYTNNLAQEVSKDGGLQPDFLAIWNWSDIVVKELKDQMHLLIDGTPRSLAEAEVLDTALTFYKRKEPVIIYINVSAEWSRAHMKKRGRADDSQDSFIEHRINWFDDKVIPAIEFYRNSKLHEFIEVNGELSIEEIHSEIIKSIRI